MLDLATMPLPLAVGVSLGLGLAAVERVFGVVGTVVVGLHALLALVLTVLIVRTSKKVT